MTDYVVRPYTTEDNAALAVMWNESDDQWPGTFTGGVEMTEEQVRDWLEKETCLMRLVVEHKVQGAIVGYGSLWETPGRSDSCYVALLNVHPAHQGRSLARRMLTQMVDWATEQGYQRVTIGTWPANLKSVPLYKKVGFHWVPELNVFMENYIPAVRQLAVTRDFFDRCDWYAAFQRELAQVEDEQRHPATGDMKVFVFRWQEDSRAVEAVVDRYAQAITGINVADFSAYAVVDESEPAQGLAYPVRWQVTNKRDEPLHVSILADGEQGIDLHFRTSFELDGSASCLVEAAFVCAADAPRLKLDKHNRDKTPPRIKSTLVVGGEVVELGTGLQYHPAVAFDIEPAVPSLLPGVSQTVHLILRNRAGRPLQGTVSLTPQPGLETDWQRRTFELAADQYAGLPLTVTCTRAGAASLLASATFQDEGRTITTEPRRFPLLVTPLGGVAAGWRADGEAVVIENDVLQMTCRAEGGACEVRNKVSPQEKTRVAEEIGPPFTPRDLGDRRYDLALAQEQDRVRVTLTGQSSRLGGVTVEREITVTGSPLVQMRYRVVNDGPQPQACQVRPSIRFSDEDKELGTLAMPRVERLVVERAADFPTVHGDMPQKPEKLAEQWLALERDGQVWGVIWDQDVVEHEFWWSRLTVLFGERKLEPQCADRVGPFYLYAGPGDWRDVRRIWQRLAGQAVARPAVMPQSGPTRAFDLSPAPLLTLDDGLEATLTVDNVRQRPLKGRVVIEPPPGWQVSQSQVAVADVADGNPLSQALHLTAEQARVGAFEGRLRLESELADEERPFSVIRLGDRAAQVTLEMEEAADQPVWRLDNGRCVWQVTPDFHAGIISWCEAEGETDHLMTSFPGDGGLGWMRPWFGGIRPFLSIAMAERDWPGRLHQESFSAESIAADGEAPIPWRGLRLTSDLQRETFQGLRAELDYLTVGGSNVLKVVFRMLNTTSAHRRVAPGLFVFAQVDGAYENGVLYGDDVQRKRMPHEVWTLVGSWGAVVNPRTGRALAMVSGSGQGLVGLMDWGKDGGHFWLDDVLTLPPYGTRQLVTYLALAGSLDEARRYAVIGNGQ